MSNAEIADAVVALCALVIAITSIATFIAMMIAAVFVHERLCDIRNIIQKNQQRDPARNGTDE